MRVQKNIKRTTHLECGPKPVSGRPQFLAFWKTILQFLGFSKMFCVFFGFGKWIFFAFSKRFLYAAS
jgi:hypothetical protein